MAAIEDLLTPGALDALRVAYDRDIVTAALSGRLAAMYDRSADFVRAVSAAFYDETSARMAPKERERCLIALLAARGEEMTLAIHVYVALMEGMMPDEIGDVLFLVGIYSGVSHFARGLLVAERTLQILAQAAADGAVESRALLPRLAGAFGLSL